MSGTLHTSFGELSERQSAIAKIVRRYRAAGPAPLRRRYYHDLSPKTIQRDFDEMTAAGWLQKSPLYGRKSYWRATPKLARAWGEPDEFAAPLGPAALPEHWARFLHFMRRGGRMLAPEEFGRFYADLASDGIPSGRKRAWTATQDPDGGVSLQRIFVDLGADSRSLARKMLRSAREDAERSPAFFRLLSDGGYGVLLLVANEPKKRAATLALRRLDPPFFLRCFVVGELNRFLPDPR